ncbi:MAG: SnoaL-like domain-containing protein [Phycisphaerae bacterium]
MESVMEIGKKLVELVNEGKSGVAIDTLYSPDIVSIEAMAMPPRPQQFVGLAAVKEKAEWFESNHDIHHLQATGPWPHGDRFITCFKLDVTAKTGPMAGRRFTMEEAALYTVKNRKIVKEEFFYSRGG